MYAYVHWVLIQAAPFALFIDLSQFYMLICGIKQKIHRLLPMDFAFVLISII